MSTISMLLSTVDFSTIRESGGCADEHLLIMTPSDLGYSFGSQAISEFSFGLEKIEVHPTWLGLTRSTARRVGGLMG